MPFFLTGTSFDNTTPAPMGFTAGDYTHVAPGAGYLVNGNTAVAGNGANQSLIVDGSIGSSNSNAVSMRGAGAVVSVGEGGRIFNVNQTNFAAVFVGFSLTNAVATMVNAGLIDGAMGVLSADSLALTNTGQIIARGRGVVSGSSGETTVTAGVVLGVTPATGVVSTIINGGTIEGSVNRGDTFTGRKFAILEYTDTGLGHLTTVENSGRLGGELLLGLQEDTLINAGLVTGLVNMGTGDDRVENAGVLRSSVVLGDGADVYLGRGAGEVWGSVQGGAGNDALTGSMAEDLLLGGADADVLRGRGGDDVLNGGAGQDRLTGWAGADVFVLTSQTDTGLVAATADVITDMQRGVDLIDLSAIDARAAVAGNQAFTFVGTGSLAGGAGRLRYDPATGLLQGDVNGNGVADFAIVVANRPALTAVDFVL